MQIDQGDFILSEAELSAALSDVGRTPNGLGIGPIEGIDVSGGTGDSLEPSVRPVFDRAMTTLVAPTKIARFHYTVADESISRSLLAWAPGADDDVVALVGTGENRRVSNRSQSSLRLLISRLLAANDTLIEEGISLFLSTGAIMVFLAIAEHLRLVRYHAIQTHATPYNIFNQEEIEARLAAAGVEDFRWPLLFLDKVMPAPIAGALTSKDVDAAMDELILAGLVDSVDETAQLRVYELAGPGVRICDGLLHEVAKVALGISAFRDDGEIGHEVMLLVRSGFDLFLFDLAGQQGAIASLGASSLDELMKGALRPPSALPTEGDALSAPEQHAASSASSSAPSTLSCPNCGLALRADARFCSQCGAAIVSTPAPGRKAAKVCPVCGHSNRANSDFCVQCGTELPES